MIKDKVLKALLYQSIITENQYKTLERELNDKSAEIRNRALYNLKLLVNNTCVKF